MRSLIQTRTGKTAKALIGISLSITLLAGLAAGTGLVPVQAAGTAAAATDSNTAANGSSNASAEEAKALAILQDMSTEEKVAQLFIVRPETISRTDPATSFADFLPALQQYSVGGIILFSKNLTDPTQTLLLNTQLQQVAASTFHGLPYFLCVDEEGGSVARLANNKAFTDIRKTPSMLELAGTRNAPEAVYNAAAYIGSYLKQYGFNTDFAPDADVYLNPGNKVIGSRSFGSDPNTVAQLAAQYAAGLHSAGIKACYKHFPGHGNTAGDSHLGYVYTDKDANGILPELFPFASGAVNGVDFIMTGHIATPNVTGNTLPASLQKSLVTGILRDQWQYQGLIITDGMDMGAIVKEFGTGQAAVMAVQAGNDIILTPDDFYMAYQAVLDAVRDGTIPTQQLDASVLRIIRAKLTL